MEAEAMPKFAERRARKILIILITAVAGFAVSFVCVVFSYVLSYVSEQWLLLVPVVMLLDLLPPLVALVSLIGLIFRGTRFISLCCLVGAVCCYVGNGAGSEVGWRIKVNAYAEVASRGRPLLEAIRSYEGEHGHLPESLNDLVPAFIPEIPSTGLPLYPEYAYLTAEDKREFGDLHTVNLNGNQWIIWVYTENTDLWFMYFPLQNYSETGAGNSIEQVEDWAFIHG